MAVDLKSGCFEDELDQPREDACIKLSRQVEPLTDWIAAQESAKSSFVLLGDFNRRMDIQGDDLWRMISNGNLVRVNAGVKPRCYGGGFNEFIDHIILSPDLGAAVNIGTFEELTYSESYRDYRKVSDHCPIAVKLPVW